jgi:hypothetical protein
MLTSTARIMSVLNLFFNAMLVCRCSYQHLNFNIFPMPAIILLFCCVLWPQPIPVSTPRCKAWICGLSQAGNVGSIPARHESLSLTSVVCCQVEVSASGRLPIQRSPKEFGVSECIRETFVMRRPWLTGGCCAMKNKIWSQCMIIFSSR